MKIAVVCSPGVGDALILQIVSHHLSQAGYEVSTVTPHRFGRWLAGRQFTDDVGEVDAVFLQHDNSKKAEAIRRGHKTVYTFYGCHSICKHGELRRGFDYVCDRNQTMVANVVAALDSLFGIQANTDNGFSPIEGLVHRKHLKRVAIHSTSGDAKRNWPEEKFIKLAQWLEGQGFVPSFLPLFPTLEELASFIYESGYFVGNDSGPGHIASCLKIPHLIIGREEKHMRHWRPGWGYGEVITPPRWVPNWKGLRLREKEWKKFTTTRRTINKFKIIIKSN